MNFSNLKNKYFLNEFNFIENTEEPQFPTVS